MNRRKFFGTLGAAITAAIIPIGDRRVKDAGFISTMYSSPWDYDPTTNVWWRSVPIGVQTHKQIDARTIAALERAWKECVNHLGQEPEIAWITDTQLVEYGDAIHRSGRA